MALLGIVLATPSLLPEVPHTYTHEDEDCEEPNLKPVMPEGVTTDECESAVSACLAWTIKNPLSGIFINAANSQMQLKLTLGKSLLAKF